MPVVHVHITRGATRVQKQALVSDITDTLTRNLGKAPEHVHVVIHETAEEDWGYEGMLTDEWKAQRGKK